MRRQPWKESRRRKLRRARRQRRHVFLHWPKGKRLYARRSATVEPLNSRLKRLFGLDAGGRHRGLASNRTQILASICAYRLLLRYNCPCRGRNGKIEWILDAL